MNRMEKIYKRNWETEFYGLEFKDKRLKKRFFQVMEAISTSPDKSILCAAGTRISAKAAYRLFANEEITMETLLKSISKATVEKLCQINTERILLLQDTTSICFGNRKGIDGMGYYCDSEQKGMMVHSCIAVTESGLPVGIIHQEAFTRKKRKDNTATKEEKKARPVEEKEGFRWINTLRQANNIIPDRIEAVTVCDREGDFYELFADAQKLGEKFLVRLTQNRLTKEGEKIFDKLKSLPVQGTMMVQVARNPKEHTPSRKAAMEIRWEKQNIKKPARRKEKTLPDTLPLTAIYVRESGKKDGLSWFLLTNNEVKNWEDAEREIRSYAQRWKIERFHFVLKNGCKIEEKQSRSYECLKLLTLLYSVIALQILNLTYLGRLCPDLPAELFFEDWEWKVLYCAARKTKILPSEHYCIQEVIYDLASLGGRKGAPSDGIPGAKSLWEGMLKLYTLLEYREFLV